MDIIVNKHKISLRVLLIQGILACLIWTPDVLSQQRRGGQPGAFLRLGVGARAMSMGGAFTALANDPSASYWNAAGLGALKYTEFMGTYAFLSMDRRYNYASFAFPIRYFGTIGVSWINLNVGELEGRDLSGRVTGTFSNSENAYVVSLGIPLLSSIYLGLSAKYLTHSLELYTSTGFGVDAGILIKVTEFLTI